MEGKLIWITGLAGSGKTTVAKELFSELKIKEPNTIHLDGDMLREILGNTYTHTITDRKATAYIYCRLCSAMTNQGMNVIISTISLFHEIHEFNKKHNKNYYEIFLEVNKKKLLERNQKKLYTHGNNVMGVHQEPELPKKPSLVLKNNDQKNIKENVKKIIKLIQ